MNGDAGRMIAHGGRGFAGTFAVQEIPLIALIADASAVRI